MTSPVKLIMMGNRKELYGKLKASEMYMVDSHQAGILEIRKTEV